jgi:hypothetical protein
MEFHPNRPAVDSRLRCPIGKSHERRSNGSGVRCGLGVWDTPIEIDVQQRADSGTKSGLNRTPLDDQKVIKVNDLAAFGLLATDQKVRSSNLFGRAILSLSFSLHLLHFAAVVSCSASR